MNFYSWAAAFVLSLKSCKKQIYIRKEKRTSNNCLDRQIKLERSWWMKKTEEQRMDAGKSRELRRRKSGQVVGTDDIPLKVFVGRRAVNSFTRLLNTMLERSQLCELCVHVWGQRDNGEVGVTDGLKVAVGLHPGAATSSRGCDKF